MLIVLLMGNLYASLEPDSSISELPAIVSWAVILLYIGVCCGLFSLQVRSRQEERKSTKNKTDGRVIAVVPGPHGSRVMDEFGVRPPVLKPGKAAVGGGIGLGSF